MGRAEQAEISIRNSNSCINKCAYSDNLDITHTHRHHGTPAGPVRQGRSLLHLVAHHSSRSCWPCNNSAVSKGSAMAGCGTVADYERQWQADGGGAVAVCGGAASYIFMRQLAEERNDKKSAKSSRR